MKHAQWFNNNKINRLNTVTKQKTYVPNSSVLYCLDSQNDSFRYNIFMSSYLVLIINVSVFMTFVIAFI